jgi:hypothetical protein
MDHRAWYETFLPGVSEKNQAKTLTLDNSTAKGLSRRAWR